MCSSDLISGTAAARERFIAVVPEILNTTQLAKFLGVSTQYLEIARLKGNGPPFSRVGRLVRYRRATIDAWLEAHEVRSTSEERPA